MSTKTKRLSKEFVNPILTIWGIMLFLLMSTVAMLYYAGGTLENPHLVGYSFISNKFSDLGMSQAYSGENNMVSFWLFNMAVITAGFSLIPIIYSFSTKLSANPDVSKGTLKNLTRLGIFVACCFSLIGLTPKNLGWAVILHTVFQDLAFVGMLIYQLGMIYLLKRAKLPAKYAWIFTIAATIQCAYFLFLFRILPVSNEAHCIAQKIIVYTQLLSFLLQCINFLVDAYKDSKNVNY